MPAHSDAPSPGSWINLPVRLFGIGTISTIGLNGSNRQGLCQKMAGKSTKTYHVPGALSELVDPILAILGSDPAFVTISPLVGLSVLVCCHRVYNIHFVQRPHRGHSSPSRSFFLVCRLCYITLRRLEIVELGPCSSALDSLLDTHYSTFSRPYFS